MRHTYAEEVNTHYKSQSQQIEKPRLLGAMGSSFSETTRPSRLAIFFRLEQCLLQKAVVGSFELRRDPAVAAEVVDTQVVLQVPLKQARHQGHRKTQ